MLNNGIEQVIVSNSEDSENSADRGECIQVLFSVAMQPDMIHKSKVEVESNNTLGANAINLFIYRVCNQFCDNQIGMNILSAQMIDMRIFHTVCKSDDLQIIYLGPNGKNRYGHAQTVLLNPPSRQRDAHSCGVFAIAYAKTILCGRNPMS